MLSPFLLHLPTVPVLDIHVLLLFCLLHHHSTVSSRASANSPQSIMSFSLFERSPSQIADSFVQSMATRAAHEMPQPGQGWADKAYADWHKCEQTQWLLQAITKLADAMVRLHCNLFLSHFFVDHEALLTLRRPFGYGSHSPRKGIRTFNCTSGAAACLLKLARSV